MAGAKDSKIYKDLGASSSKAGVLDAVKSHNPSHFVELNEDVCGDTSYYSLLHADGVGTKSIVAYLAYKETGDPKWFRSLAQDSTVMNLDDIACVGAFESLTLSNTIGRNRSTIPEEVIKEIIEGYREFLEQMNANGIKINACGGETADLGDLVRTAVIDSTLFARVKKSETISTNAITPGDIIIGLSNTGQASYETEPNSSLSSNGYTLARHALIAHSYVQKYPEIVDPALDSKNTYNGKQKLLEHIDTLGTSLAKAMLSPTRTYAPVIKQTLKTCGAANIHGIINCTGGGQTKCLRFGQGLHYIKDNLFSCPPIFEIIQANMNVPWDEMYAVFNMGHRIEIFCPESLLSEVTDIADSFKIEAKMIGHVEASQDRNRLRLKSDLIEFEI